MIPLMFGMGTKSEGVETLQDCQTLGAIVLVRAHGYVFFLICEISYVWSDSV